MRVSINSDMGESVGIHSFGHDDALLGLIDTANVACGFHAGDPSGIAETVRKAAAAGVTIGAHPGLPDLIGFGRREMKLLPDEVRDIVRYQVGALVGFLDAEGCRWTTSSRTARSTAWSPATRSSWRPSATSPSSMRWASSA